MRVDERFDERCVLICMCEFVKLYIFFEVFVLGEFLSFGCGLIAGRL